MNTVIKHFIKKMPTHRKKGKEMVRDVDLINNSDKCLQYVVLNIGGVGGKLGVDEVQNLLIDSDIAFLSETWLLEKDLRRSNANSGGFEMVNIIRKNPHTRAKRGAGGQMMLYRPNHMNVKITESQCDYFVIVKARRLGEKMSGVHILSCYIPSKDTTFICSTCPGDYYDQLGRCIQKCGHTNLIIAGDLNARTGNLPDCQIIQ